MEMLLWLSVLQVHLLVADQVELVLLGVALYVQVADGVELMVLEV